MRIGIVIDRYYLLYFQARPAGMDLAGRGAPPAGQQVTICQGDNRWRAKCDGIMAAGVAFRSAQADMRPTGGVPDTNLVFQVPSLSEVAGEGDHEAGLFGFAPGVNGGQSAIGKLCGAVGLTG